MSVYHTSCDVLSLPLNKALGRMRIKKVKLGCLIFPTLISFTAENNWKNMQVELQNQYAY